MKIEVYNFWNNVLMLLINLQSTLQICIKKFIRLFIYLNKKSSSPWIEELKLMVAIMYFSISKSFYLLTIAKQKYYCK